MYVSPPAGRPQHGAPCGCWSFSRPGLELMLIVIGVGVSRAPSMLALASLREISPQKTGHGCHDYVRTADDVGQLRNVNHDKDAAVVFPKKRSLFHVNK